MPTSMGGLGIPTLSIIMLGAFMSSLITALHNIQLHSPRLHKHIMKSVINNDQFYARFAYDQVMEHHNWFDERDEPVYFQPANMKKAMSSAVPTEKQLNGTSMHASNKRYSQLGNSAFVRQTQKQKRKKKCASGPGKYTFQWLHIPPKTARWGLPPINFPGHMFDIASVAT